MNYFIKSNKYFMTLNHGVCIKGCQILSASCIFFFLELSVIFYINLYTLVDFFLLLATFYFLVTVMTNYHFFVEKLVTSNLHVKQKVQRKSSTHKFSFVLRQKL
jgi:hypothetical protein